MADTTAIEWCDSTFNPWIGCTRVSPACDDCYAARSTPARTLGVAWGPGEPRHRTGADTWAKPTLWNARGFYACANCGRRNEGRDATDRDGAYTWACKACGSERLRRVRRRVFCASLADVFDNEVPDQWRVDLFKLIAATPNLDWLLVTKRIGNVARMLGDHPTVPLLPNIWLGITVVNQAEVDRDVPKLLRVPAAVRFLSVEPMLGPIELGLQCENWADDIVMDPETGARECCKACDFTGIGNAIDWVICGGESGPKARPMHPDWARSLRDQCAAAGVAFNFKQWGQWVEVDGDKPTRTVRVESDISETLASRCDGFISLAGEFVRSMDDATTDDPYRGLRRIGKKASGRVLDGRTHDGFPGAAS